MSAELKKHEKNGNTDDISALPDLKGYGQVRSLHQAMVRDSVLKDLVVQFTLATTNADRQSLATSIIYRWAGVDGFNPTSRGGWISDGRMLFALEKFFGKEFFQFSNVQCPNPGTAASIYLNQSFNGLQTLIRLSMNSP